MWIDELPESLKIQDEELRNCLNNTKLRAEKIWEPPLLLLHYTDHSPAHSERIIEALGKLLQGHPNLLNEYERFVLLEAIYLHDISMQFPTYAGLPKKEQYSLAELEKVRENHHLISAKMILESIKKGSDLPLGLESEVCRRLADPIAKVVQYHRKLDLNDLEDTSIAGKEIKLRLLSALLRLGDELDADWRRVKIEVLKRREIPVESKFHWWSHHYVKSVSIKEGHITLHFGFPESYRNDEITEVFKKKADDTVRKTFLETYDILDSYGLRLYRDIEVKEEYVPEGEVELIPPDLREYIEKKVLLLEKRSQEKKAESGTFWYVDGTPYSDDAEVRKCLATIFRLSDEGKNFEAVKEIECCRILTMAPSDKMTFFLLAGNCYYTLGNLEKAEEYYKDVLNLCQRKDLQEIYKEAVMLAKSGALGNIGLIYQNKGEIDKALKYHKEALKIDRDIGYKQGEASDLANIGLIYQDKGEIDKALKYLEDALKIDRDIGYKQGEASDLGNIGAIYQHKGEIDKALKYHKEALKIHRDVGYKQGEASDLGNIGSIYRDKREFDKALKYHKEALKIHRDIGHKQGEANDLANIGAIYQDKGELDKALKYLEEALNIFLQIGTLPLVVQTLRNMATIYFKKEHYERGFLSLAKALSTSSSKEEWRESLNYLYSKIKELVQKNDWKHLEKINICYTSEAITDEIGVGIFTAIYEYALYKKTGKESHKKAYQSARRKLPPEVSKLLNDILGIRE